MSVPSRPSWRCKQWLDDARPWSWHADGQLPAGARGEISKGPGDVGQRVGPLHRDGELAVQRVGTELARTLTSTSPSPGPGDRQVVQARRDAEVVDSDGLHHMLLLAHEGQVGLPSASPDGLRGAN